MRQLPAAVRFLDLLTISNSTAYKATVNFADLEALYSPLGDRDPVRRHPAEPVVAAVRGELRRLQR